MLTWYYQKKTKNKEELSKKACERFQDLSDEEKDKKRQYACEWYRNLSEEEKDKKRQYVREWFQKNVIEDEKQRLVEHINNYSTIKK